MPTKLPLFDRRMLEFMQYVIKESLAADQTEFLERIGFGHANNLAQVKNGTRSFRAKHIQACCDIYGVDANFFFVENTSTLMRSQHTDPVKQIREALKVIDVQLAACKSNPGNTQKKVTKTVTKSVTKKRFSGTVKK